MEKPNYLEYYASQGMHSAMNAYAQQFNRPALVAHVVFEDGSELLEKFERATKEVYYRVFDPDEGKYSVDVHTGKYKEPFFSDRDMTSKELKEGYDQWLAKNNKNTFKVKWSKAND